VAEELAQLDWKQTLVTNSATDTWQDKVLREINLVGAGLDGVVQSAETALDREHCLGTLGKFAFAAGAGLALTRLAPVSGLTGLFARSAATGMGASFAFDALSSGGKVAAAVSDAWQSGQNNQEDTEIMQKSLGQFAFDSLLMTSGGMAGGKLAQSFDKISAFGDWSGTLSRFSIGQRSAPNPYIDKIPSFDRSGLLPAGSYRTTWPEFYRRFGFNQERRDILASLQEVAGHVKNAGGDKIIVGGSLISNKAVPNDFDAAWIERGVDKLSLPPDISRQLPGVLAAKPLKGDFYAASTDFDGMGIWLDVLGKTRSGRDVGVITIDLATMPSVKTAPDILQSWRDTNRDTADLLQQEKAVKMLPLEYRQSQVNDLLQSLPQALKNGENETIQWLGKFAANNEGTTFDGPAIASMLKGAGYRSGAYINDPLVKTDRKVCAEWVIGQCIRVLDHGQEVPFFVSSFAWQYRANLIQ